MTKRLTIKIYCRPRCTLADKALRIVRKVLGHAFLTVRFQLCGTMSNKMQDEIRYVVADQSHRDGILALVKNVFVQREPITSSFGHTWEESKDEWEGAVNLALAHPQTHVALNGSNEIVGFRLSRVMDMSKLKPGDSIYEWLTGETRTMADHLTRNWPTYLKNSKKIMQFMMLCVHPKYGGKGIGIRMCEENLALAKKLGCDSCSVVASNWMSQKIFEKMGFTIVEDMSYDDFRDANGELIVKMKDPSQKRVKFYVMKLA